MTCSDIMLDETEIQKESQKKRGPESQHELHEVSGNEHRPCWRLELHFPAGRFRSSLQILNNSIWKGSFTLLSPLLFGFVRGGGEWVKASMSLRGGSPPTAPSLPSASSGRWRRRKQAKPWTFKFIWGDDVRRFVFQGRLEYTTFEYLRTAAGYLFGLDESVAVAIIFTYMDEEGDLCTLCDATLPDALCLASDTCALKLFMFGTEEMVQPPPSQWSESEDIQPYLLPPQPELCQTPP